MAPSSPTWARLLSAGVERRMQLLIMRAQKVAPQDLEISDVQQAAVALDQRVAIHRVPTRQRVPRDGWSQMMGKMQIVEQKQRSEKPRLFDDRGAPLDRARCAMFGE